MKHMARRLDQERPGWRKTHVIQMDNAPYHKSREMLKTMEEMDLPLIFSGPHSYNASPAELLFAAFKRDDINPRHVKMGKS